jgi:hypothetical protein
LSTSSDSSFTWSSTVVRVRPHDELTTVDVSPRRLLQEESPPIRPSWPYNVVVALLSLSLIMRLASDISLEVRSRPLSWARSRMQARTCTLTMLAVSYFSLPR